ncbi:MAG: Endo/excinuclease amino domain protein [Candidatus Magasanikbacteria bacterium GW2011_GWC2_37_14]|uniref:Endo/excinuclease amino domain protein n=1 Tax=Candidatus Magasanikbacteria bacterium GW2011_GWC2_37_14 TaxID=1619046 RepID=A0A0G0JFU5_9BACT|nr:MAG: Endo/excinuclease amino domain protein [Candidatus Magasanikbacteria bacterium GW2011_GWC2_37_14]
MNYYTYIARCNDESLYTGITNDILKREKRHNQGFGSNYTRARLPIKIIYFEKFNNLKEAARREIQIKGWTKIKKENLIKGEHPTKNLL